MGARMSVEGRLELECTKAVKHGDLAQLQRVLNSVEYTTLTDDAKKKIINTVTKTGTMTLLQHAAFKGHYDIARVLLQHGADVHWINHEKGTALHEACHTSDANMVSLLLHYGASPFVPNVFGRTAMDVASFTGNLRILRLLFGKALFAGTVEVKMVILGLVKAYDARQCVIQPCINSPTRMTAGAAAPVQSQAWATELVIYSKKNPAQQKARIRLDGCRTTVLQSGEAVIRVTKKPAGGWGGVVVDEQAAGFHIYAKPAFGVDRAVFTRFVSACTAGVTATLPSLEGALSGQGDAGGQLDQQQRLQQYNLPMLLVAAGWFAAQLVWSGAKLVIRAAKSVAHKHMEHHGGGHAAAGGGRTSGGGGGGSSSAAAAAPLRPPTAFPAYPAVPTTAPTAAGGAAAGSMALAAAAAAMPMPVLEVPSAPPVSAASPAVEMDGGDEDDMCIVCLAEPRQTGFLHGESVHRACCRGCAQHVKSKGQPCPLCRQPIERILDVYD